MAADQFFNLGEFKWDRSLRLLQANEVDLINKSVEDRYVLLSNFAIIGKEHIIHFELNIKYSNEHTYVFVPKNCRKEFSNIRVLIEKKPKNERPYVY